MNLYASLLQYAAENRYPMHMPGHKRAAGFVMENPYALDVTEVEGTDNLHHPEGVIRQEMERMKERYGTEDTYLLVNGSTCGILSAISACCRRGDQIVVARNCHRSVYHAIELLELDPIYLYPEVDERTGICLGITPDQVEETLAGCHPSCVVITSPTYEGVVSEIRQIGEVVHGRDIPLVVDEAHGAHFAWSEAMPETAMQQGADLVIESLHKTLPALTQTGLLHRGTDRVPAERVEHYLGIYETSSPSYVLMGSISQCMQWLGEEGERQFPVYVDLLAKFRRQAEKWKYLALWEIPRKDPSKLVITTVDAPITGPELADRLRREYNMEVEMAAPEYLIAMTSVGDTPEGLQRFARALTEIDAAMTGGEIEREGIGSGKTKEKRVQPLQDKAVIRRNIYDAVNDCCESLPISDAVGRISVEYAMVYPPGIPFLVPGEEVTESIVRRIQNTERQGLTLLGLRDETGHTLGVCRQEEEVE